MTRANTDDNKWPAVRQSHRHRCRTLWKGSPHCDRSDRGTNTASIHRRACKRGTAVMNRTSPPSALSNWPASRLIAGALAIIIFAIDTFTPLDIAIAVLYVIVVLMAANFLRRRGVI